MHCPSALDPFPVLPGHIFSARMEMAESSSTQQHRALAPGPGPTPYPDYEVAMTDSPPQERRNSSDHGKKRASMACLACKKSKRKCSGTYRCDNCIAYGRECVFDETKDQRRRVAAKHTAEELVYFQDFINKLLRVVRAENESYGQSLFSCIRRSSSLDEIWYAIRDTLPRIDGNQPYTINFEGSAFRPQVMDINYLCKEPPYLVPAQPWTSVTSDSSLVSHLVSLYFTWDYPSHAFLDRDVFIQHMNVGDMSSELCSPFLVNALLANACHFSEYSEVSKHGQSGDIMTKGDDFLAEAERLGSEKPQQPTLSYLQGTLMLYEKYSLSGEKDLGYNMLHRAICIGQSIGLIGASRADPTSSQISEDMEISLRRTAWGLLQIDAAVHTQFLRPSIIRQVILARPEESAAEGVWTEYPFGFKDCRPAHFNEYFARSCDLCEIARGMSQLFFARENAGRTTKEWNNEKATLRSRLSGWYEGLNETVRFNDPLRCPPPYVIIMGMRYYTLTIILLLYKTEIETVKDASSAMITPDSPTGSGDMRESEAYETAQFAARSIARLTHMHQQAYHLTHAHHFVVYAINLALFVLLELSQDFDILNDDFLYLACTFGNIASRSRVGRNLFHLFRQNVRSKRQGSQIRETDRVTDVVKDLFDENFTEPTPFDVYAMGLEKLEDERYQVIAECHPLCKVLDIYETLSLGRDEIAPERDLDHG
ncbi:hypothetical protein BJY01DRAFT_217259 [Aspergillus pseudoustus]|uniref:Zn(2)-C6 fungal-type domain-containing protein n=1 Tax=Aspergillus pseudoustus TaxID=1810923 RepID=A0ABR4JNV7_9EURO